MSCRSGCPTPGSHKTWGDCAKSADLQIDRHGLAGHRGVERDKDNRLDRYRSIRHAGVQPAGTSWRQIRDAEENGGVAKTPVMPAAGSG